MKHSLHVVDEFRDPPVWEPRLLRIGSRSISIVDTGDGTASRRFADGLASAGAIRLDEDDGHDVDPELRIVIRGVPTSAEARLRAEVLEEAADLVLGADRPAFARLFGSAYADWAND